MNSERVRERAEASFKKKEIQMLDGRKAMAEYTADGLAVHEKTARLRALRLARDAADIDRAKNRPIILAALNPILPAKKRSSVPAKKRPTAAGSRRRVKG